MKYILFVGLLFILLATTGCTQKSCPEICRDIPANPSAGEFNANSTIAGQAFYYGQLYQKKVGTPDDWIHSGEESRSAGWFKPTNETVDRCDCTKRYKREKKQGSNNIVVELEQKTENNT
jgi:hypothetical protein